MSSILHILHLEDDDDDAELVAMTLRRHGILCEIERVAVRDAFSAALDRGGFDIILSDFSLPLFDGLSALKMAQEKLPDVPFLFVSGTLGEEVAIDALRSGASDYVFKHRLPRLGPAVNRAVADAQKRRELHRAETAMAQSEHKYRQLFECLSEAALLADARSGRIVDTNRQAEILLGRLRAQILGANVDGLLAPATLLEYRRRLVAPEASVDRVVFDGEVLSSQGQPIPVMISAAPIVLYGRRLILGLYRDVTEQKRIETEIRRLKERLARHGESPATEEPLP